MCVCARAADFLGTPTCGCFLDFAGTCSAQPLGNYPVTWCGFGISTSGLMFPGESFILQNNAGTVVIEDRLNAGHVVPTCYATQVSQITASSVVAGGSSFTATWTRPITLSAALLAEGYLNIPTGDNSLSFLAACGETFSRGRMVKPVVFPFLTCRQHKYHFGHTVCDCAKLHCL